MRKMFRHLRYWLDTLQTGIGLWYPTGMRGGQEDGFWRVYYPDAHEGAGGYSRRMFYNTACDYASMFHGSVVWIRYKDPTDTNPRGGER